MTSDDIVIKKAGLYRIEATINPAVTAAAIRADADAHQRQPLTRQQRITFDALVDYIRAKGYPPTVRELADILELSSASAATARLHALRDRGWITMAPNSPRAITVIDA